MRNCRREDLVEEELSRSVIAVLAALPPAIRAARLDAMEALRVE